MMLRIGHLTVEFAIRNGFLSAATSHRRDVPRRNYFMFAQDIPLVVVPYALSRGDSEPFFDIDGESTEQSKAVRFLFDLIGDDEPRPSKDDLDRVIRHIAERCAWTGRLLIDTTDSRVDECDAEVDYDHKIRKTRECLDRWVAKVFGIYFQFGLIAEKNYLGAFIGWLPKSEVLDVRIPPTLGGLRGYKRTLRRLDSFDTLGPEYWRDGIATETSSSKLWQLDHTAYRRLASAYRDRAARAWGWSGRDSSTSHKTEYFSLYQHLRMQRAAAMLRSSIVNELNKCLEGKGIQAKVVLRTLKGSTEKEKVIEDLRSGEISFGDAFKEAGFP